MQTITLNKLILRDFQGGTVTLDAQGMDVFIFSANAGGKTRLVSAFSWLLFNKDSLGRSDFEIKNLDATGEAAHGLEHTVEAELDVNGRTLILKKVFSEKWTKKRGSATQEFSGHTTRYFIDGVPIQEKEYNAQISEITGDEFIFRLLTSPTTFPSLPALPTLKDSKRNQRSILLDICEDVSDMDVVLSNEKLKPLKGILEKRSLEDHRKIVTARKTEINKEMDRIPVRIDEVRRGMPDVTGLDRDEIDEMAQGLELSLNDAKLRLQGVTTGGNIGMLNARMVQLSLDVRTMENDHRSGNLSSLNRINQAISEIEARVNASRRRITSIAGDLKCKDGEVQAADGKLVGLRSKWAAIDAEEFLNLILDTCPTCGQALPGQRVFEAREKALAAFNESKAERLKEINDKGMSLKGQKQRLELEIADIEGERAQREMSLISDEEELARRAVERDGLKRYSEEFSGIRGRAELLADIVDIGKQIKAEKEEGAQEVENLKQEVLATQAELTSVKAKLDMFTRREQGEKRMAELKKEEKALSVEYEKLESDIYLIEQFIKTKVSLLTTRINQKFEFVRFKLFNLLVNGGVEECCEITVGGVPFNAGLNNAARIQAGCDIIRTLQRHYGMRAPVFVDNRESVTDLPEMACQMISLVVSPADKMLRIEPAENMARAA